ncbi:MAG TPA: heat-inducible transcriptional repressor HrcA [Terriglobia bacterium]|nr:heat-inducible transcriptional repressor HrcA [Terriglobia bacterium]
MLRQDELSGRKRDILQLLVQTYINCGEPVGSKTLSRSLAGRLSPATIRNTMSELEDAGYLTHPHTSAGRVPSEKAFRFYVNLIPEKQRVDKASERRIVQVLEDSDTPDDLMSKTSFLLSEISKNIGIVIAPPLATTQLKHIEFLDLGDGKILVIFVSTAGLVQRKVIRLKDHYQQGELDRAGRFLVERFSDRTLTEIRNELLRMMEAERTIYDRMLKLLCTWNDTLEGETEPESIYVQGRLNLLDHAQFANLGPLRELFRMLEEKGRLVKILNECIASNSSSPVKIAIGSELGIPAMRDFTVVTSSYIAKDSTVGFLGIIGPIRMEYDRVISTVGFLGRLVSQRINT